MEMNNKMKYLAGVLGLNMENPIDKVVLAIAMDDNIVFGDYMDAVKVLRKLHPANLVLAH